MTTTSQILDALLEFRLGFFGGRWNFPLAIGTPLASPGGIGQAVSLTYAFPTSLPSYDSSLGISGFSALNATQISAAQQVFAHYSSVAQITYTASSLGNANIALAQFGSGAQFGSSNGWGFGPAYNYFFNGSNVITNVVENTNTAGDVWIRNGAAANSEYSPGGYGYELLLHEIGHAMGFKHPFEGAAPLPTELDNEGFTVMSYNHAPQSVVVSVAGVSGSFSYTWKYLEPRSLMVGDMLALQYTYGANNSYNTGSNTYSWAANERFFETIWDAGGNDTINCANQGLACLINLNPGTYSSIGLRQTHADLYMDIPSFAASLVGADPNLSDAVLYSGLNNLGIAYGANIENAIGGSGNDTFTGNALGNMLTGNAGDDSLDGGDGNDTLIGGAGNDTLIGGNNTDTADYSSSADGVNVDLTIVGAQVVSASQGGDTLSGVENLSGSGLNDTITGDGTANTLFGNAGDDRLTGNAGNDSLDGGTGNDTLIGGAGNDTLTGGANTDLADYSAAIDGVAVNLATVTGQVVSASQGTDTLSGIENITGGALNDTLTGDGSANVLVGNAGNDSLDGGAGNDTLVGGSGNDSLTGGSNIDTADYSVSADGVTVNLNSLTGQVVSASQGTDTLGGIENLNGSSLNDSLTGDGNANAFLGNGGDDSIVANAGNDTADGGDGNDTLDGGDDNDSLSGGAGFDLIIGGAGNDTLRGGDQGDTLIGGAGDDFISAGKGLDSLDGGDGNDTLAGLLGSDTLVGGNGIDSADYSGSSDAVIVALGITFGQFVSTSQATDTLSGIENLIGSLFNDTLSGDLGNNVLTGNAGDDTLLGSDGFDTLEGGDGDDSLSGMNQGDVINGGNGNDFLGGGKGLDRLDGGEGNDTLQGGLGGDSLTGGNGVDTFMFTTPIDGVVNVDTISDFASGTDLIQISVSGSGMANLAAFVGQTIGTNANLTYSAGTGMLGYDADGVGSWLAVNFAILGTAGHPPALGVDFVITA